MSIAAVGCLLAVSVAALGGAAAEARPVVARVPSDALPPGGVPGVKIPTIHWTDAGNGYQQATAAVPYDYAHPAGKTIRLQLARLPAGDPAHKIGSLFVNFGGPGVPAASTVLALGRDLLPPAVLARYDLVGVDPRGTGGSRPVRCLRTQLQQNRKPYAIGRLFPTTTPQERRAVAQVRRYAAACRARNGDLLDHVGTTQVARDLDVVRAALGDRQINLVGWSYGSFLAQVVAHTFPTRTGALILDSVVDPAWATGPAGSISWIREHSDLGSWQTLRRFFFLCGQAGPQRCGFAADGDPRANYLKLTARLRTNPLRITVSGHRRHIGYADVVAFTISTYGLYTPAFWPLLGEYLHAAYTRDTRTLADITAAVDASSPPGYQNALDAQNAITCGDTDNPHAPSRYRQVAHAHDTSLAPYAGSRWAYGALTCAFWRGRTTERYTGPWTAHTRHPVLIVNTRHDPATPYRNAVHVHQLLPNSALLTVNGVGHGGLLSSACAMNVATRYLLTGNLPRPATVCTQDREPFDNPAGPTTPAAATARADGLWHAATRHFAPPGLSR